MPKTATLTIRLDPKLKSEAEQVLKELGLTPSQAITLFFKQVIYQRGLPFEIKLPDEPNEETNACQSCCRSWNERRSFVRAARRHAPSSEFA